MIELLVKLLTGKRVLLVGNNELAVSVGDDHTVRTIFPHDDGYEALGKVEMNPDQTYLLACLVRQRDPDFYHEMLEFLQEQHTRVTGEAPTKVQPRNR